jgi:cellulose synthase (UDP-forming)
LALRGTSELQGVEFGIRSDEVVTSATLQVSGATSPGLIPEFSNVTVTLNEQYIGTIPVIREHPEFSLEMPVSPVFFQDLNRLNFRFAGRYTPECNDPLHGLLWSTVSDTSTLTLTLERLPAQRELARLPQPFFDSRERTLLSLPFVLSASPGGESLRAAGMTASWFGISAAFRGANFPVVGEVPSEGNAVMVVVANEGRAPGFVPAINGPTLGVIANPNDPTASILLIAGRTGEEAVTAATSLVIGNRALGGDVAMIQPVAVPARQPYDAPNWINTTRPVKLGELVDPADLQVYGYTGLLHVPFRTAPDFYTWRDRAFPMDLRYRAPPGPIIDIGPSRLDVGINGIYLNSFSLQQNELKDSWLSRLIDFSNARADAKVEVPSYDVFGSNDLQFYFDARPLRRGDCVAIPGDIRMSVDPDSTIDLSRGFRFAQMPNLQYFVNSGFPFTRMADLSETAVVLPDRPSALEISSFLNLMGRIGALTGFPTIRMAVVKPDTVTTVSDRDLLMIGTTQRLQGVGELLRRSSVSLSGNRISMAQPTAFDSVRRLFGDRNDAERSRMSTTLQSSVTDATTVIVGSESPLASGRSMVAILAASPQALEGAVAALRENDQAALIQGDLAVLTSGRVTSYRAAPTYTVGLLPFWLYPSFLLRDQPYAIVLLMLGGCVILGLALYWAMSRKAAVRMIRPRTGAAPAQPPIQPPATR